VNKNSLHRHYDRLTPEERFRLDVLAMARGDEVESERLVGSCPRFSYTMNDRGFAGRWQGAIEITLRVYIPLGEQLAKLQLVDAFREMIPYSQSLLSNIAFDAYFDGHESGSRHAWTYAGKSGGPPAWPDDGPDGEIMEPDEDEKDPAMDRDVEELETIVQKYGGFLPEILDRAEYRLPGLQPLERLRRLLRAERGCGCGEGRRSDPRACDGSDSGYEGAGGAAGGGGRRANSRGGAPDARRDVARGRGARGVA
jgi:hypothetical protein